MSIYRAAHAMPSMDERVRDFDELYVELDDDARRIQASRCMMCGVAFCQMVPRLVGARPSGCPLHNLIPEWNELVYRGRWKEAAARLALTSPLPEFTSRVCPALCEAACNLGSVDGEPTTIHDNERAISDRESGRRAVRAALSLRARCPRIRNWLRPCRSGGGMGLARRGARVRDLNAITVPAVCSCTVFPI